MLGRVTPDHGSTSMRMVGETCIPGLRRSGGGSQSGSWVMRNDSPEAQRQQVADDQFFHGRRKQKGEDKAE